MEKSDFGFYWLINMEMSGSTWRYISINWSYFLRFGPNRLAYAIFMALIIDFNYFSFSKCCIIWCGVIGFGFCASFLLLFIIFITKGSIASNVTYPFYIVFCIILTFFGGSSCLVIRKCRDKTFVFKKGMSGGLKTPIEGEVENPLMEFDMYNFYSILGVDTKGKCTWDWI